MPRHDGLYLSDILEAIQDIREFIHGVDAAQFQSDRRTRAAILQRLMTIGEASRQLSPVFKERHPFVPWREIIAFRNFAIHEYFSVDWQIVWVAATEDVGMLEKQLIPLLEEWEREAKGEAQ